MAISHVGNGAQVAGVTATLTPTYPAAYTAVELDAAFVILAGIDSGADPTTPTNWELLASFTGSFSSLGLRIYCKILTTSEALPAFTLNGWATNGSSVQCLVLRGTHLTASTMQDATAVTQSVADDDGFGVKQPNGITTATANSWIIQTAITDHTNALFFNTANGWTLRMGGANYDTTSGQDHAVGVATILKATAGAQTSPTWEQASAWNFWAFLTVAIKEGGAGGTPLTVQDASHGHTVDNVALTQHHVLAVQDAAHGSTSDAIALTQHNVLAVDDATQAHTVDNVDLSQRFTLTVAEALHGHTVDAVALTQHNTLTVADALQAHDVDNVVLSGSGAIVPDDTVHGHTADNVTLTQHHVLTVAEAFHAHSVDNLVFVDPDLILTTLRMLTVRAEDRTLTVTAESRNVTVEAADRTLLVEAL